MSRKTIGACCIVKNEEELILGMLESIKDCDAIFIADTGSTDRTLEIINEFKSKNTIPVHLYIDYIWNDDYSEARNFIQSKCPTDVFDKKITDLKTSISEAIAILENIREEVAREKASLSMLIDRKSDLSEGIIDWSGINKAERIMFFERYAIFPRILERDKNKAIRLTINLDTSNGKHEIWTYKVRQGENGNDMYIDNSFILVNPTPEQIEAETIKRGHSIKSCAVSDYYLSKVDDKYLSTELLEYKNKLIADEKEKKAKNKANYDAVDPIDRKFVEKLKKDFIEQAEQEIK